MMKIPAITFSGIAQWQEAFTDNNYLNFPNGGLYAVNRDGSKPRVLNLSFMKNREFGARVMKVMNMFDPLTDHGQDILVEIRKGGGLFQEDRAFYGNIVRLNTITGKEERIAYNRGDILEFDADREKTIRIGMAQHCLLYTF